MSDDECLCGYVLNSVVEDVEDEEDEDEDEDEDEEYDEDEEDDIPAFDEAVHALWVMRTTFEMLDEGRSISPNEPELAPLALARGGGAHGVAGGPRVVIHLPPADKSFQIFRGHDSLEYVRTSRSKRHPLCYIMDRERGYESA
jgi:hypothetical protein